MRPPYNPGHVERVTSAPAVAGGVDVTAVCSCQAAALGPKRHLGTEGVAGGLIDDFNAHRATYVHQESV